MKYKIELDQDERFLVALTKGHFPNFTKECKGWNEIMLKTFSGVYRYNFEPTFSNQFQIFQTLFKILKKISENETYEMEELFRNIFNPYSSRQGTPLEKGIIELCNMIRYMSVKGRYSLYVKPETKKRFYENTKSYKLRSDN